MKKLTLTLLFLIGFVPVIAAATSAGFTDSLSEPTAMFLLGWVLVGLAVAGRDWLNNRSRRQRE